MGRKQRRRNRREVPASGAWWLGQVGGITASLKYLESLAARQIDEQSNGQLEEGIVVGTLRGAAHLSGVAIRMLITGAPGSNTDDIREQGRLWKRYATLRRYHFEIEKEYKAHFAERIEMLHKKVCEAETQEERLRVTLLVQHLSETWGTVKGVLTQMAAPDWRFTASADAYYVRNEYGLIGIALPNGAEVYPELVRHLLYSAGRAIATTEGGELKWVREGLRHNK